MKQGMSPSGRGEAGLVGQCRGEGNQACAALVWRYLPGDREEAAQLFHGEN